MEFLHTVLTFLSKWATTVIPIITVLTIILPKTRKWLANLFRSLIGMEEFSKDIKDVKKRIDKIESTIDSIETTFTEHKSNDKQKAKFEFTQLKNSIMRSFMVYLDKGYITFEELSLLQEVYDAYIESGGNGAIKSKWENEILKLPNKPPTYK